MKTKIIILALLLNLTSCKSQVKEKNNSTNKTNTTMEYFNINKYKDWEIDTKFSASNNDKYLKLDNKRVKILDFGDTFQEEQSNNKNPYLYFKTYFSITKSVKATGQNFYDLEFGIWKEYDNKGNLIKETDYDEDYKFSIDDLIKKMRIEYNYDLMNVDKTYNLNRFVDKNNTRLPLYEVYYKDETNNQMLHSYIINGTTGEVLFATIRYTQGKQGSLHNAFIKHLKEKN
jgi:hypothetical protein